MRPLGWKELLVASNGLQCPAMVENLISPVKLEVYTTLFGEILREFMRRGNQGEGMKLFLGGKPSHARLASVMEDPPRESERPADWAGRIFGEEPFGMILNNLENYSNDLARTVAHDISPLLEQTGLPLRGLALLFFMGNYGFTPFGVHKDNPGEEGFLFHIGPGVKTFYIWETERFLKLSGGREFHHSPEEILPEATRYELRPGDLMFFPSETYHIACTPDFSISMVLDFNRPSPFFFKRLIIERLAKEMAASTGGAVAERYLPLFPESFAPADLGNLSASLAFETELNEALEDYLLRLRSNGGFYNRSGFNTILKPITTESVLRGMPPFRLLHRIKEGKVTEVYTRGHRTGFGVHRALPEILDALSDGKELRMDDLRNRLAPEWDFADIIALVSTLQNADAIVIE